MNLSKTISRIFLILYTVLALSVTAFSSELPRRIPARINDSQTFLLPDNTPRVVVRGSAIDQGAVPASHLMPRMFLHFTMTPAQSADLNQLLQGLQDRRSPQYHKFLTPEQYAARFGLHSEDLAKVTEWLEMSGFSDIQIGRSARWVSFSGTAARAASAFHTSVHRYMIDGQTYLANTGDPRLPKSLQGIVEGVRGLHNIALKPHLRRAHPNFTSSLSGKNYLAPDDWTTIYDVKPLYAAGQDGTGVTIAVMGQSDVLLTDIQAFRAAAGLPANNPTVIVPPGDHDPGYQTSQGDETESDLDLEWAGAIAKNANILFVTASPTFGNGVVDSLTYAIDNNVAPIISLSYGQCEAQETTTDFTTQNSLYQQANAQGITIVASSGDAGATACDQGVTENAATQGLAVNFPASSQYVTGIGGTEFNEGIGNYWNASNNSNSGSAISYIPEESWDDYFQSSTGGGVSTLVLKPAWQTGNGVPNDGWRDVPDISFAASPNHDGFLFCHEGWCTNGFRNSANNLDVIGGTSAAAPPFAGVLALIVQQKGRLGNINQTIYSLAQMSNNVFHDITSGGNYQDCQAGTPNCPGGGNSTGSIGYSATYGYDQVTGWGSVDAYNLSQQWNSDFQISATPATLTLQPGASVTAAASITPQNGFNGQVTYTCSVSSSLIGVTCSVPSTPVSASGTATVTIAADSNARLLPPLRLFPMWPTSSHRLPMIVGLSLLLAVSMLIGLRNHPLTGKRMIYAASSALLLVIALGAVGCGGGTSAGTTATPPAPVTPALSLTCNVPNAMLGVPYTGACVATGGITPYTYSISAGSLPNGLILAQSSGVISGTTFTNGTASFTVQVTDQTYPPKVVTQAESMVVTPQPLAVSCSPTTGNVGVNYYGGCTGTGGIQPYSFSVVSGALPPGLSSYSSTSIGQIELYGSPTAIGTTSFTMGVTDSQSPAQKATQAVNFVVGPGTVTLNCSTASAQVGVSASSSSCQASGGAPPYTYSLASGSLPPGLTANYTGGILLGGIPTTAGTYSFAFKAVDSETPPQSATQSVSLVVAPTQPLVLSSCTYPAAQVGVSYSAGTCTATGGAQPYSYSVLSGTLPPGLYLLTNGTLTGQPTTLGTYSFVVKLTDGSAVPLTATYQITNFVVQPRATETGTVTITATSGNLTSTTTVTVTVP